MQAGTLDQLKTEFNPGVALAASAYPSYYPWTEPAAEGLMEYTITKRLPPGLNIYTGWVDFLGESADTRTLRLHNAPSFILQVMESSVPLARHKLYSAMDSLIGNTLDYRKDIGLEFIAPLPRKI